MKNLFDDMSEEKIEKKRTVKKSSEQKISEIFSVSSYLDHLNTTLKAEKAKVSGEISDVQEYPSRSYLYFSLKDVKDQSTVSCFMWKNDYRLSGLKLQNGMEVVISTYPNIYKPNGRMTLQVEQIELVGEGALKLAYEELKQKLEVEGLFSVDRKRSVPQYPHRIGLITSKSGAVIHDFLTNIGKFGFEIVFVDSKVEGGEAIKDLMSALHTLRQKDIDVLVILRGGGSLESFMAFNNEVLVRAVADFPVPVVTGIGHDRDMSLVSLVSDANVSTPTAVAHLLNESWNTALSDVMLSEEKLLSAFQSGMKDISYIVENSHNSIEKKFTNLLSIFHTAEETLARVLQSTESNIRALRESLSRDSKDIILGFMRLSTQCIQSLSQSEKNLSLLSPHHQLSKGYSIVRHGTKVIRSRQDVSKGDKLDIVLSDGTIESIVEHI